MRVCRTASRRLLSRSIVISDRKVGCLAAGYCNGLAYRKSSPRSSCLRPNLFPTGFDTRQIGSRLPPGPRTAQAFFGAKVHWTFAYPSSPPGRRVAPAQSGATRFTSHGTWTYLPCLSACAYWQGTGHLSPGQMADRFRACSQKHRQYQGGFSVPTALTAPGRRLISSGSYVKGLLVWLASAAYMTRFASIRVLDSAISCASLRRTGLF